MVNIMIAFAADAMSLANAAKLLCVLMCVQPITEYRAYEQGRESPTQWDAEPLQPHRRPRSPSSNPITQVSHFCALQHQHSRSFASSMGAIHSQDCAALHSIASWPRCTNLKLALFLSHVWIIATYMLHACFALN